MGVGFVRPVPSDIHHFFLLGQHHGSRTPPPSEPGRAQPHCGRELLTGHSWDGWRPHFHHFCPHWPSATGPRPPALGPRPPALGPRPSATWPSATGHRPPALGRSLSGSCFMVFSRCQYLEKWLEKIYWGMCSAVVSAFLLYFYCLFFRHRRQHSAFMGSSWFMRWWGVPDPPPLERGAVVVTAVRHGGYSFPVRPQWLFYCFFWSVLMVIFIWHRW